MLQSTDFRHRCDHRLNPPWYLAYPLSSRQVRELLAERGIDVSHRTILTGAQVVGPLLPAEARRTRRVGRR